MGLQSELARDAYKKPDLKRVQLYASNAYEVKKEDRV